MSLCIRFIYIHQAKFTKLSQSTRTKFRQVIKLKIMKSLHHGRHCDHKTLNRAIPDLNYVPSKWSMSKFSIKFYETLTEFWGQLTPIHSAFAKKLHPRCLIESKIRLRISINTSFAKMWNPKFKMIPKEYESGNIPSKAY